MPIVIGAVAPHGIRTIPLLSDSADGALGTRQALLELGRRFAAANLDVLFIAGPHGVRVNGFVSLSDTDRGAGAAHWKGRTVELNVPMDLEFANRVADRAAELGVPVARIGYGGSKPASGVLPLDWSVIIPAWFAAYQINMVDKGRVMADLTTGVAAPERPTLVVANPSRVLPRETNVAFGRAVAEAADADGRRIGFIASCDWAHAHNPDSRFGYHPEARAVDAEVVQAIKDDDILRLIDLAEERADNAAIDGLWQLLMLEGVKQVRPMAVDFLSYEVAEYFGMIVATYQLGA